MYLKIVAPFYDIFLFKVPCFFFFNFFFTDKPKNEGVVAGQQFFGILFRQLTLKRPDYVFILSHTKHSNQPKSWPLALNVKPNR